MTDMKNTQGEVWVFAEQEEGKLSDVPFELLGKARELAGKLGVKVGAVLMGSGVESLAKPLFEAGADIVHLVDDPALKVYRNKIFIHNVISLKRNFINKLKLCVGERGVFDSTDAVDYLRAL